MIESNNKNSKQSYFVFFAVIIILGIGMIVGRKYQSADKLSNQKTITTDKKSNKSIPSNKEYYQVAGKSFGFASNENDLKDLLRASQANNIEGIKRMVVLGRIKTFSQGKKVILVKQGLSTIIIRDPDTGIEYYGVTESIK